MGGTAYFSNLLDRLKKDLYMIEDELKRDILTRTPLTLDQREIFLKLKTIHFAHLRVDGPKSVSYMNVCLCKSIQILIHLFFQFLNSYELFQFIQAALIDCPDLTNTHFHHLFKNTKLGLSATLKEILEMCSKKFEWNIMIFIVQLHYALSIYNAFCLENNLKYNQSS
jgi:hypothetical protein